MALADSVENDNSYAVYRFTDPIKNFKIRVKIERLTSNALLPSLQRLKVEEDLSRLLDKSGQKAEKPRTSRTDTAQALEETKRSEFEEVLIGWQQKVFSRRELAFYGKAIGPESTALDRKYYEDIQKLQARGKEPGRIFTYIEGDPEYEAKELEYFVTDSPNEEPSQLALGVNTVRKRRGAQPQLRARHLPKTNVVINRPTDEDIRNSHLATLPHQTMYIMADLSDRVDTATGLLVMGPAPLTERVLCVIQVFSNSTMILEPDLNEGKTAYIVETGAVNNEVYHYYLEHASTTIQTEDLIKEKKLFQEVCLRQQNFLSQIIGNDFDLPPPSYLKLSIFGEIVSAKNFEYDDLYVYYCLDLPQNWFANASMIFSGYTHTASATTSSVKDEEIMYYSHPFEFEVYYKPSPVSAAHELPSMPKIYFQVASQDGWGRHRTEGYAYIDVPTQPGSYNENLACWRPRGDSIFNELRGFFIGGSHELEDISYIAMPKHFESEKNQVPLSRFGFRTVTTGTLNVRLSVVFQSHSIAVEKKQRRPGTAAQRHGFDAFMSNINAVIFAFQEAKKRALEVRDSTFHLLSPRTGTTE